MDREKQQELKKTDYAKPGMTKHEPVKMVQGSGGSSCSLYYVVLYY